MKKYIVHFLFVFYTTALHAQNPILPLSELIFEGTTPDWTHISIDTSILDNEIYDGRHHIVLFNNLSKPIEKDGYLYVIGHTGIFDREGGIIEKIDKNTGEVIWTSVYDRRTFDYNEQPLQAYINENNQLEIVNHKMLNSSDVGFPFLLLGTSVTYSVLQYELETGALLNHIYPEENNYVFNSGRSNYLFKNSENQFYHIQRPQTATISYYTVRPLNEELNAASSIDTVFLNGLPTMEGNSLHGGLIALGDKYISLDAKNINGQPYYQLNFWNDTFSISNTITLDLEEITEDNFPQGIGIRSVNDDKILLIMVFNRPLLKGVLLNQNGNIVEAFDYKSPTGYAYPLVLPFFKENSNDLFFCGYRLENDERYIDIVKVGDEMEVLSSFNSLPDNTAMIPRNINLLENNKVLISCHLAKDTLLAGETESRFYHQGLLHTLISGDSLGLTSIDFINEKQDIVNITVAPNPAVSSINIENLDIDENKIIKTVIYDMLGRNVYNNNIFKKEIDVSAFEAGLYILLIETKNGLTYLTKFEKL